MLDIKYDDGFIAYLNGTRVAGRNAPDNPAWDSNAEASHSDSSAVVFEGIDKVMEDLATHGSYATDGCSNPEGVVVNPAVGVVFS